MSPAISIASLLLLSAIVVESLDDRTEEEEDFPTQLKQKRADHHAEEKLQDGGQDLCGSCKSLVTEVKKKMGKNTSQAKIAKLLDEVCGQENNEVVQAACKKITAEIKDKLSEAVADGDDPKSVCKKVKLCKKKPPPPLWTLQMKH